MEATKKQVKVAVETIGNGNGHDEILSHFDKNIKTIVRVNPTEKADIYVVNSCAYKGNIRSRFLQLIDRYKNKSPRCKVIAIGCDSAEKADKLHTIDGIDAVLGNIQKYNLENLIKHLDHYDNRLEKADILKREKNNLYFPGEKTRAHITVNFQPQDYFCLYCNDKVRHNFFLDTEEIVFQARLLARSGVREVILTGNRIGEYKSIEGHDVIDLLKRIESISGIERVKISTLEIENISDRFIEYLSESNKYLSHLHIPLRSGSSKVLKEMGTNYRLKHFDKLMNKLQKCPKDLNIGLDVIVGSPAETRKEFEKTCQFISDSDISYLHIFPFSESVNKNEKTKNISIEEKLERKAILKEISDKKKFTFIRKNIGTLKPVLYGERERAGYLSGLTDNYIRVKVKYNADFINSIQHAHLKMRDTDGMVITEVVNKIGE